MDESEMEEFRVRIRLMIIEQMLLRTALLQHVLARAETFAESAEALKGWLETNANLVDRVYGEHFREPAQTALYADEVRAIIDSLKERVDHLAADFQSVLRHP